MIGKTTITIEDAAGVRHYAYELSQGDLYFIPYRWINNLGLAIPKKGTLFHFGGRDLVIMDDNPSRGVIEAIDAKRFWWIRYQGQLFQRWLRRTSRRIVWQLSLKKRYNREKPEMRGIIGKKVQ